MRTTATRPLAHAIGIAAVLATAVLAVAASPVWLLATVALTAVNLIRYTLPVWRSGRVEPATIPLAFINIALLTGAAAFALTSL